jgi:hypothetical protein
MKKPMVTSNFHPKVLEREINAIITYEDLIPEIRFCPHVIKKKRIGHVHFNLRFSLNVYKENE